MTSEIRRLVGFDDFGVDRPVTKEEARVFLGLPPQQGQNVFTQPPMPSPHTHRFDPTLLNQHVFMGYDGSKSHNLDSMILATLQRKKPAHLKELALSMSEEEFTKLYWGDLAKDEHVQDYPEVIIHTYIKENNHMATKLRIPNENITLADLKMALKAMGSYDTEELLDLIAVIQDMAPGEVLKRANHLKPGDLGKHVTVVDGDSANKSGFMTDHNYEHVASGRGNPELVLDGKMVKTLTGAFVIVSDPNSSDPLPS